LSLSAYQQYHDDQLASVMEMVQGRVQCHIRL
jgi:hypothetical protein